MKDINSGDLQLIRVFLNVSIILGLSILFTFEEKNAFAYQGYKDFIMIIKEILKGFGVLCKKK